MGKRDKMGEKCLDFIWEGRKGVDKVVGLTMGRAVGAVPISLA